MISSWDETLIKDITKKLSSRAYSSKIISSIFGIIYFHNSVTESWLWICEKEFLQNEIKAFTERNQKLSSARDGYTDEGLQWLVYLNLINISALSVVFEQQHPLHHHLREILTLLHFILKYQVWPILYTKHRSCCHFKDLFVPNYSWEMISH
jgi:hypothetical protein